MESKMTSIEWLIEKHFGSIAGCTPDFRKKIEQAKELLEIYKTEKGL
jgi:hypothetical protein